MKKTILVIFSLLILVGCTKKAPIEIINEEAFEELESKFNQEWNYVYETVDSDIEKSVIITFMKDNKEIFDIYYRGVKSNANFVYHYNHDENIKDVFGYYLTPTTDISFEEQRLINEYEEELYKNSERDLEDLNLTAEELQKFAVLLYKTQIK